VSVAAAYRAGVATKHSGPPIDTTMANSGFLVPRPSKCGDCRDGMVGMDMCERCAGTGTVFKVNGKLFPDTRDGYERAEKELVGDAIDIGYWAGDGRLI
jgi:hypothetical protein